MNEQMGISVAADQPGQPGSPPYEDMVWIPGGTFLMGSDHHYPEEGPTHAVTVSGFWMDTSTVTNAQFQRFVEEADYVTVAERQPDPREYPGALPELLVPGSAVFQQPPHVNANIHLTHFANFNLTHPGVTFFDFEALLLSHP